MKDRIKRLIQTEGITPSRLADLLGVQRSSISHILAGRNNASLDIVQRILQKFPQISHQWLLFGTGEMYTSVVPELAFAQSSHEADEATEPPLPPDPVKHTPKEPPGSNSQHAAHGYLNQIPMSMFATDKKVVKIVMFFSDKTFVEYVMGE